MAQPKSTQSSARAPKQTTFLKVVPKVNTSDILVVLEAAALLQVSPKTIYSLVKADTIPHARVGRKLRFSRQRLTQWIAQGGERAGAAKDGGQKSLEQMLNSGEARIATKR